MTERRPTGISLMVNLYLVLGILSLIWGGMVLGIGGLSAFFGGLIGAENMTAFGNTSAWSGYVSLITGIVQIVIAYGLTTMKKWAWILALAGVILATIQGAIGTFTGGTFGFICGSLGLIIPVIILFYLLRKDIRSAFGIESS